MDFNNMTIYVTPKKEDDIFKGTWIVKTIDFEEKTVGISNGRVRIWRNFDEVNIKELLT